VSLLRSLAHLGERRDFGTLAQDALNQRRRSSAGFIVSDDTALHYTTFFRCVQLLSDTIGTLPKGTFRGEGGDRLPTPKPIWIETPNGTIPWIEWLQSQVVSLLLRGAAYARALEFDGQGYPTQLRVLHPDLVVPLRDKAVSGAGGGEVEYDVRGVGRLQRWPLGELVVVNGMTLPGSGVGLSPVSYAAATIGKAIAAQEWNAKFFAESAIPPSALVTDAELEPAEARRLKREWVRAHSFGNQEPAVLSGGVKFETISISAKDAQFIETLRDADRQIAGFMGVPLHMVGLSDMQSNWGTGLEENTLQWITYGIGPHVSRLEQAFSLLMPRPRYFRFNLAGLLRGRLADRYAAYITGRQGGWLSIDEIRALEDMPPLPEGMGADYLQPLNYSAIPPGGALVSQGGTKLLPDVPVAAPVTDEGASGT
jgi:HK97 family phage portal protein